MKDIFSLNQSNAKIVIFLEKEKLFFILFFSKIKEIKFNSLKKMSLIECVVYIFHFFSFVSKLKKNNNKEKYLAESHLTDWHGVTITYQYTSTSNPHIFALFTLSFLL